MKSFAILALVFLTVGVNAQDNERSESSTLYRHAFQVRIPFYPYWAIQDAILGTSFRTGNLHFLPLQIGYQYRPNAKREWSFNASWYYPNWFQKVSYFELFVDAEHRWVFRQQKKFQWYAGLFVPIGTRYPQWRSVPNEFRSERVNSPGFLVGMGLSAGIRYNFGRFHITYGPRISLVKPVRYEYPYSIRRLVHISPIFQVGYKW